MKVTSKKKHVGSLSKNHMEKHMSKSDQDCVQGFSILSQIIEVY